MLAMSQRSGWTRSAHHGRWSAKRERAQLADAVRATSIDLKMLFLTGYAENAALNRGHLKFGTHVITKPFAMEALATRIKALITIGE